jgi:hypothetical protein
MWNKIYLQQKMKRHGEKAERERRKGRVRIIFPLPRPIMESYIPPTTYQQPNNVINLPVRGLKYICGRKFIY